MLGCGTRRTLPDMAIRIGTRVSWNTSQGVTHGKVVERRTSDFTFDGQHFTASAKEPKLIVESDKTGARAAHAPDALTRRDG
jgi:hypothetical protein